VEAKLRREGNFADSATSMRLSDVILKDTIVYDGYCRIKLEATVRPAVVLTSEIQK